MFKRNHGAHFVDSEEGSIVVRLKVSNAHELKRLIEDIKSGKVLESIKELYQSEASENELKNVFGKVETVEISINETDISKAESYFSTGQYLAIYYLSYENVSLGNVTFILIKLIFI